MDQFEHDLLHLVSAMIAEMEKWHDKIMTHIDNKYVKKEGVDNGHKLANGQLGTDSSGALATGTTIKDNI